MLRPFAFEQRRCASTSRNSLTSIIWKRSLAVSMKSLPRFCHGGPPKRFSVPCPVKEAPKTFEHL